MSLLFLGKVGANDDGTQDELLASTSDMYMIQDA